MDFTTEHFYKWLREAFGNNIEITPACGVAIIENGGKKNDDLVEMETKLNQQQPTFFIGCISFFSDNKTNLKWSNHTFYYGSTYAVDENWFTKFDELEFTDTTQTQIFTFDGVYVCRP